MKKKFCNLIFIVLFSALFTISFLTPLGWIFAYNGFTEIATYFVAFAFFMWLFHTIFNSLLKYNPNFESVRTSSCRILIYALPCIIIWSFYLIAFFPGVMTSDSLGQWGEMLTGKYVDANPVVHTFFIYLITRIWFSPAAIAISQILILSTTFAYGMYTLEKAGVTKKIIYTAVALFSLYPVNGILSITLWKDVLFSSFILLFTILLINIILDKNWINKIGHKALFILTGLGVMLLRHNGIVSFIGTVIILMWLFRKNIRPYAICITIIIIAYILIKGPVYQMANVKPGSPSEAFGIPIQQISAVIRYNGKITDSQLKEIDNIMPAYLWGKNYVPTNVDYVKFSPEFKREEISKNKLKFIKLWSEICIQNPEIVTTAYFDQTKSIWQIREQGTINRGSRKIDDNSYGLKQTVISKPITLIANITLSVIGQPILVWFFWKPAIPMFIIIFTVYTAFAKGFKLIPLVLLPVFLNIATLLLAVPAQDFRYLYSNALTVFVIAIFSLINLDENGSNFKLN